MTVALSRPHLVFAGAAAAVAFVVAPGFAQVQPANDVVIPRCLVQVIDEIEVPAEEAGVITALEAKEGQTVGGARAIGKIDDRLAVARVSAARAKHERAVAAAENDVNKRYAEAAKDVAYFNWKQAEEANLTKPRTVSQTELRTLALTYERARLQVEQAVLEQDLASKDVTVALAELDVAQLDIDRRDITSPIDGLVIEIKKRRGAWVNAGDPILKVIRMDRLRVAGHVNAEEFGPQEIADRPVRIKVRMERGREEFFTGKITYVNPVQTGGEYPVWAEVANRLYPASDQWMLRPGVIVEMAIELEGGDRISREPMRR